MVFGLGFEASLLLGAVSLFLLVYAAELVVDRMTSIAAYFDIPDVLIAMSVVSIGTSLPEIISHVIASAKILTYPGGCTNLFMTGPVMECHIWSATVLGANIGSDVVQQTLVVGIVVFSFAFFGEKNYFRFSTSFLKKNYFPMMGTTLMCIVLGWDGIYSRIDGLVLMGSFAGFMYFLYYTRDERLNTDTKESDSLRRDGLVAVVALSTVLVSAHLVLNVTERLVEVTGLGGSIIGVVTLGVVSAFPEMFTAISGIRQRASGISLGTLIGSNITNPLVGIGGGALLSTYWVPRPLVLWDLPLETVTAGLLLAYLLFVSDRKLGYKGGIYLILLYVFYIIIRFMYFATD